ncbi:MAG: DUF512 domain-containing protein [Lachnospiraceae bacterium]|nr:DUF512 domain-containing protein [Lachnospiraceae bacterium]
MENKGHLIVSVEPGSIAEELGIEPGSRLLMINDKIVEDVFDYRYLAQDEDIVITVIDKNGEEWDYDIEKDYGQELGLVFEGGLMSEYHHCCNKCIFCFIDQLPPGMRKTLYFKDDDARLSFLQGNYVTLTNMSDKDVERICFYKMSPINISIHTLNKELRVKMLKNKRSGEALRHIRTFVDAGIEINGQIVLCKGYNDGKELDYTLKHLEDYMPGMKSLSIVPIGITKYREGLAPIEAFTNEECKDVIKQIEPYRKYYKEKYGTSLIYASDEFYLNSGTPIPPAEEYEGFPQIENGVGMTRSLIDEFEEAFDEFKKDPSSKDRLIRGKFTFVTGKAIEKILRSLMDRITEEYPFCKVEVVGIRNDFFGEKITVAGLVTAGDIIAQLKGRDCGDYLVLPTCMLRAGEDVFLDDLRVCDIESALQKNIRIVKSNGISLINVLCTDYVPVHEREVPYEQADSGDSRQA